MATYAYGIILYPEKDETYTVDIPDLQIGTQGENIADCIAMARDAIGIWGIATQDDNEEIPAPSGIITCPEPDAIVTYVDIDFDAYRSANEKRG